MTQTMTVAIVDDEPDMRESISQWLSLSGFHTETFPSAEDALKAIGPDWPGVVISDIRMPGMDGMVFLKRLMGQDSGLPVIMITGHGDVPMAVEAMKAGAIDFLTKPFRDQDLLDAIQRGIRLDRERRSAADQQLQLQRRYEALSPRERSVMAMVAEGLANKQIAAALELKEITVKVHRAQAMRKLAARSLPELVLLADRLGLIPKDRLG